MKDVIRMQGMQFYAYHGATAAERETGRLFEVDCDLETDLAAAGHSDELPDTIDYAQVYAAIKDVAQGRAFSLLEGLANEIASKVLESFPVYRVTIRVRKLHPPLNGPIKAIEVELSRAQGDTSKLIGGSK